MGRSRPTWTVKADHARRARPHRVADFARLRNAIAAAAIRLSFGDGVRLTWVVGPDGKVWWSGAPEGGGDID